MKTPSVGRGIFDTVCNRGCSAVDYVLPETCFDFTRNSPKHNMVAVRGTESLRTHWLVAPQKRPKLRDKERIRVLPLTPSTRKACLDGNELVPEIPFWESGETINQNWRTE